MTGAVAGPSAFGQALTELRKPLVRQCVLLVPTALDLVVLLFWGRRPLLARTTSSASGWWCWRRS